MTASRPAQSTRRYQVIGLSAAFGIGMLVAIQSRLNGELGFVLGDGVAAALISFGSGLLILLIGTVVVPPIRRSLGNVWRAIRTPMRGYGGLRWTASGSVRPGRSHTPRFALSERLSRWWPSYSLCRSG